MYIKFAKRKYSDRNPKIAKIFDVYRIKGSSGAIAKMAGILSIANNKSVNSTIATTTNKGVATLSPFSIVKNLSPSY